MLRVSACLLLLLVLRAGLVAGSAMFNCPSVKCGAIVRLRPCFNNKAALGICASGLCGKMPSECECDGWDKRVVYLPVDKGADETKPEAVATQWRVVSVAGQTGMVRFYPVNANFTTGALAVGSATKAGDDKTRTPYLVPRPATSVWRWDLKGTTSCRVILSSNVTATTWQRIGKPASTMPTATGTDGTALLMPFFSYDLTVMTGDTVLEVEFVKDSGDISDPVSKLT